MIDVGFKKSAKIKEKEYRKYVWNNAFKVKPVDNEIKWVVLINLSGEKETTICNYNPHFESWEVLDGEEVICWMNFEEFLPNTPTYGNFLKRMLSKDE